MSDREQLKNDKSAEQEYRNYFLRANFQNDLFINSFDIKNNLDEIIEYILTLVDCIDVC